MNANSLSASKLNEKDFSLQLLRKINSSFDSGLSHLPELLTPSQNKNEKTLGKNESAKDLRQKVAIEFKN